MTRDRVAVITGASRGIGLAIADRLAAEGTRVCLTARNSEGLIEALARFPQGTAMAVPGRADDPGHRLETLERTIAEFGRIDVLVNNAGINPAFGPLNDLDLSVARKILEVNVIGTLGWVQSAIAFGLGTEANASIVNIGSISGVAPQPGIGWYGVSKAAVAHLTATLAVELAPAIRVNAVAPAVVKTAFAEPLYAGREIEVAASYPMRRLGTPEDVASAVAYLISDAASWVTGQVLTVDGGLDAAGGRV